MAAVFNNSLAVLICVSLDFQNGLSVLTGETGAGKSIWIEAVSLALGARADSMVIRHGQARCEITLIFDLKKQAEALLWLKEHDYDADDECVIRRIISQDGPSRSSINGHPCPLQQLREFAQFTLNIHGQHEHQTLLKREVQQKRLDTYGKHQTSLKETQKLYQRWHDTNHQLNELKQQAQNREAEVSLFRYQLEELTTLNLKENEWAELTRKHQQLHNASDLITQLNQAIEFTVEHEKTSASMLLQQAIAQLNEIKLKTHKLKQPKNC